LFRQQKTPENILQDGFDFSSDDEMIFVAILLLETPNVMTTSNTYMLHRQTAVGPFDGGHYTKRQCRVNNA